MKTPPHCPLHPLPADSRLPPVPIDVYQARRARVLDAMRATGGGIAIVPTASEVVRNRDSHYPYRYDSYFYYLTGFAEPEAWLMLNSDAAPGEPTSALFCRAKQADREIWEGVHYGPEAARDAFGMEAAYPVDELDQRMAAWLANAPALYYGWDASSTLDAKLRGWLDAVRSQSRAGVSVPAVAYDLTTHILDEMRLVKDTHELAIMRQAAHISAHAHRRAIANCRPGLAEYALEAELLYEFRRQGAQAPAYNPIVAAGANACVLHYPTGYSILRDGDLVLIDAACELDGYAADITRTFPANGKFSGPQRELYEIVLAAQQAAIDMTRAGARFNQPHEAAVRVLAQGLLDTGLLAADQHGTLDDVLASHAYKRFYMHRTGHWLGMDVHDCGAYREKTGGKIRRKSGEKSHAKGGAGPSTGVAAPSSEAASQDGERAWRTLAPGMTLTVEPGLYVRAADDVPPCYWNIGIRIEDDALITATGCELLTREVPVAIDEIEALMREARQTAQF